MLPGGQYGRAAWSGDTMLGWEWDGDRTASPACRANKTGFQDKQAEADWRDYNPVTLHRSAVASCAAAPCTVPVVDVVFCLASAVHWTWASQARWCALL